MVIRGARAMLDVAATAEAAAEGSARRAAERAGVLALAAARAKCLAFSVAVPAMAKQYSPRQAKSASRPSHCPMRLRPGARLQASLRMNGLHTNGNLASAAPTCQASKLAPPRRQRHRPQAPTKGASSPRAVHWSSSETADCQRCTKADDVSTRCVGLVRRHIFRPWTSPSARRIRISMISFF